jgi:N-acetylglucosaminyldiphosphoundecaprenol N-acetyl-beta-D-mannosaminyltransferase
MKSIIFKKFRIDVGTRQEAQHALLHLVETSGFHQVITINPEYIVLSVKSPQMALLTHSADSVVVDGVGLYKTLRRHYAGIERYPGADMVIDLCIYAENHGLPVGIIVPANGLSNPNLVVSKLHERYSKLQVFSWEDLSVAFEEIRQRKIRILFTCHGQPIQDEWIIEHRSELPPQLLAMGVGGAIDFITDMRRRAPKFFQRFGFEWLWRLCTQPWRLSRILRATFCYWYVINFKYGKSNPS